jgi:hypothetical protein
VGRTDIKGALCILAAAKWLLTAPTAAWSWPLSDQQSPSDKAGKLTSSDLSSATEMEGRRLTSCQQTAHSSESAKEPTAAPTGKPSGKSNDSSNGIRTQSLILPFVPLTCFSECRDCHKCVNGKCMNDKKKGRNGMKRRKYEVNCYNAECRDGKCQGGSVKTCVMILRKV